MQCALSTANMGEKASRSYVVTSNCSRNVVGSLPSAPSGETDEAEITSPQTILHFILLVKKLVNLPLHMIRAGL